MRIKLLVLIVALTTIVGIGYTQFYLLYEWYKPAFSKEEAITKVGRQIFCKYGIDSYRSIKCPQKGECKDVKVGDKGKVIGIEEVSPQEYFVVVQWGVTEEDKYLRSYVGRQNYRIFIQEE
jgi:hypothetical protein